MARIRTLKPEIWADEAFGGCSRDARLLFVGLITQADDAGRFRAAPALLRSAVFPYDETLASVKVEAWLEALQDAGLVELYTVKGQRYGSFPSWASHQKIDRPSESRIPGIEARDTAPTTKSTSIRRGLDEDSSLEGKGSRKGKEWKGATFDKVYTAWSEQPGLIRHHKPTPAMRRALEAALANAEPDAVIEAIGLYATVLGSEKHWWTYSWRLEEFLRRGVSQFLAESNPLTRYFGPGPNERQEPERDLAAAHLRDLERVRSLHAEQLTAGASADDADTYVAGMFTDDLINEALSKGAAA